MTQMFLTLDLDDTAKPSEIKKVIRNIKGIIKVSSKHLSPSSSTKREIKEDEEWMGMINKLRNSVNPKEIDMDDEKTRYIMGEER